MTQVWRPKNAHALRFVGPFGLRLAHIVFAASLIAFGLSHFAYMDMTAPLVPRWLPGPEWWARFTGLTYLAAGAAILIRRADRLAAILVTAQMGLFGVLIWVPMLVSGSIGEFQWIEFVNTVVLFASGWVVAGSYRSPVVKG